MVMTDSSGNTVWQGEFKPFGEPLSVSGSITNGQENQENDRKIACSCSIIR